VNAIVVLLIEDEALIRESLVGALGGLPDIVVGDDAESVEHALAGDTDPDVVLLDLSLGEDRLMRKDAIDALRTRWPQVRVLVLTSSEARDDLLNMMAAGADGYITKHATKAQLHGAIREVASGHVYITPRLASYVLREEELQPPDNLSLSPREKEILKLLAEGDRDQDIADHLFISLKTVQSHLTRIRDKTGQRRRAALTRLAMDEGLI
jgi:DNA-binding NarL/FixJ family response regulator